MRAKRATVAQVQHWLNDEAKHWRSIRCRDCGREMMAFTDALHVTLICDGPFTRGRMNEATTPEPANTQTNEKGQQL